jgi:hypothetical protein
MIYHSIEEQKESMAIVVTRVIELTIRISRSTAHWLLQITQAGSEDSLDNLTCTQIMTATGLNDQQSKVVVHFNASLNA